MNDEVMLREAIQNAIGRVAPEADVDGLLPGVELRDQLDIDSFDFLNIVIALHESLGIEIPEADYGRLSTIDGAVVYLQQKGARVA
jgi:acyl carrier protein